MKFLSLATIVAVAIAGVSTAPVSNIVSGKYFDRVVIFIFENENYSSVQSDSFFGSLATQYNGVSLTNYLAITHPSQPNYIGLITGTDDGVSGDSEVTVDRNSIVDLLEAKGISWKAYMQAYAGNCDTSMTSSTYARKHNPFISVNNIQTNAQRCANIVNADQLATDIENNQVPQFVFYTPDMNNDGHDTNLKTASNWFKGYLSSIITNPNMNTNTMFVSTWDEAKDYTIPNNVQTVLFGPNWKRSSSQTTDDTAYDHYSLLRTIEDNWDLGNLGQNDASATPINL